MIFIKLFIMLLTLVLGFFQFILQPFLPEKPPQTEWVIDGEYQPIRFVGEPEVENMQILMQLAEAGDTERIAVAFSEKAKRNISDFDRQIEELTAFLTEKVISWEGDGYTQSRANNVADRIMEIRLETAKGGYECLLRDEHSYKNTTDLFGFDSISVYPEELTEYAGIGSDTPGIFIVYRSTETEKASENIQKSMEFLLEMAKANDIEGFCNRFCTEAVANTDPFREQAAALLAFLRNEVIGLEPYAWRAAQTDAKRARLCTEDALCHLQTAAGTYRCDIRTLPGEMPTLYSVSVFPTAHPGETLEDFDESEQYHTYSTAKRDEPGIQFVR